MYSQYEEEKYILEAFAHPHWNPMTATTPRFLDIGAFHPKDKSNTRALFELGWSGVMIEPSPGPMRNLLEEYGNEARITLVSAAVGLNPGLVSLYITDDAVSTSSESVRSTWREVGGYFGNLLVPVITFEQIIPEGDIKGHPWDGFRQFDFVNLDAEGISADLFRNALLDHGWRPHCWCVEHDGRADELKSLAMGPGYYCVYENGTNIVLVKR